MLRSSVDRLASGGSGVVVLEAPAGLGKTALLEYGASLAAQAGYLVRRAAPGPLERHFSFGVVRALLEGPVREASGDEREHLLDGAAAAAGELLLEGTAPAGDSAMLIAHSILWLCSAIAERRPLALVVDDAQWADRSSLEVLSYLARRVDDLPLLILIGARADDPRRRVGSADAAGLGPLGDRPAPAAADTARRDAADPPAGTGDPRRDLPRLSSRGRRQPVAAGRARPPDRRARPRGARGLRAGRAAGHRDRPHRRPPAPGGAVAARPRRGRRRWP